MNPVDLVLSRYGLPFEFYPYQAGTINELAPLPKSGHYLAVGVGKTATSTACCLYKKAVGDIDKAIVLMPPILLDMWNRWLTSIKGTTSMVYRGAPSQRKKLKFDKDFTLMSYQIFKQDMDRILKEFNPERTALVCDEATAIKNYSSQNYKMVRDFSMDGHLMLLTGTPMANPADGYAYVKLLAPEVYRNFNHFRNVHVEEEDFFGKPKSWSNLDLLEKHMKINAVRILKEDVLDQLPEITYTPIHYSLHDKHLALYKQLVEEQLIELGDGSKIDATEATALWHKCQQLVCNYGFFSDDDSVRSAGFDLIDQTMDELGDQKLIVFTNYRMTSESVYAYCREKWGATLIYGGTKPNDRQKHIDRFMDDRKCQIMVAQMQSAGYGLNPQEVCADVLFMEEPLTPILFEQAVGRVYRNGQKRKVNARVGVALGTIQEHLLSELMRKDALVNTIVRNYQDIRKALYGG